VYLLDLNVLIAMSWPQHVHHDRAQQWFATLDEQWATTAVTESGFVRLSANPVIVHRSASAADGIAALQAMRQLDGHVFLVDDTSLTAPAISLARLMSTKQVTDFHLVNLAARHEAVLATFDRAILSYLEPEDRPHLHLIP
jgi:toxin-antitoxin system PIN domain toxin